MWEGETREGGKSRATGPAWGSMDGYSNWPRTPQTTASERNRIRGMARMRGGGAPLAHTNRLQKDASRTPILLIMRGRSPWRGIPRQPGSYEGRKKLGGCGAEGRGGGGGHLGFQG